MSLPSWFAELRGQDSRPLHLQWILLVSDAESLTLRTGTDLDYLQCLVDFHMEGRVCTYDDFCKKVHTMLGVVSCLINGPQAFSGKNAGKNAGS